MIWGMRRDRVQQQQLGIDFFHFQTHGHHSTTMYRRLQIELIDNRDDKINSVRRTHGTGSLGAGEIPDLPVFVDSQEQRPGRIRACTPADLSVLQTFRPSSPSDKMD